jgi:hypothetical protein
MNNSMTHSTKELTVNILGTRGIPEGHSGFETFVLHLAPFLRDMSVVKDIGTKRAQK